MLLSAGRRANAVVGVGSSRPLHRRWLVATSSSRIRSGTTTPLPSPEERATTSVPEARLPFYFDAGYALFAKRASRPFPPPFLSRPSASFSDPLSTHDRGRDRRSYVQGEMIRGATNGDDAVLAQENFIGANDGVGQWATRPKGHAALWSRLVLHFWALETERYVASSMESEPDPVRFLQTAYENTLRATSTPNEWLGTTTTATAMLHYTGADAGARPLLYVTNLGDSQIMVIRPRKKHVVFKTVEQWHWFDCPLQLGTNSLDTPKDNAVLDRVDLEEGDVVLAMSDGVIDNLWEHEIVQNVLDSINSWERETDGNGKAREGKHESSMQFVAEELMKAAKVIAVDPFAESVFMERAIDEGLALDGGKLDDISVVAAVCKRRGG